MDKEVVKLLTLLDEAIENRWSVDDRVVKLKSIDGSAVHRAMSFGYIGFGGVSYHLTEKGKDYLLRYKTLEEMKKSNKAQQQNTRIMLDSNFFDKIADGTISIEELRKGKEKGFEYNITHVQIDQINNCEDKEKRATLQLFLTDMQPNVVSTESIVLGVSRFNYSKWGGGEVYKRFVGDSKHPRKTTDALIAEVAIKKEMLLVSNDNKLRKKVINEGGKACTIEEFKKMI